MEKEIQSYMETVCRYIKWKSYCPSIRAELQAHIDDSIHAGIDRGMEREEAVRFALENMGDPNIIGEQLNVAYQPEYNKAFIRVILFIVLFFLLECSPLWAITGGYTCLMKIPFRILVGGLAACLLFRMDWSDAIRLSRFALTVFIGIILICVLLNEVSFANKANIINSMLLLLPLPVCCFLDRVKDKKGIGLLLAFILCMIPVFVSCYVQSFAAMIVLAGNGCFILLSAIKKNWFGPGRKNFWYRFVSFPFLGVLVFAVIVKGNRAWIGRKAFFVRDVLKGAVIWGKGSAVIRGNSKLEDYPLTFMTAHYGYIFLLVYSLFFAIILYETVRIYCCQQSLLARLLLGSVLISFVFEVTFSVCLNLGLPFAYGLTVPFLDLKFGIITKIIQLGLIAKLECFGNYIFSDHSSHKLFDVEEGKIIIYYK